MAAYEIPQTSENEASQNHSYDTLQHHAYEVPTSGPESGPELPEENPDQLYEEANEIDQVIRIRENPKLHSVSVTRPYRSLLFRCAIVIGFMLMSAGVAIGLEHLFLHTGFPQHRECKQRSRSRCINETVNIVQLYGDEDLRDGSILNFRFNRSTFSKGVFINRDNTMISNVQTTGMVPCDGVGTGFMSSGFADKCCEKDQEMTFAVQYNYNIKSNISNDAVVYNVVVAEANSYQNHIYLQFWSVALRSSQGILTLEAGRSLHYFSSSAAGTKKKAVLHFHINRKTNTFAVISNQTKLYTFNVTATGKLCPIFGVYHPEAVNASLRLLYSTIYT